MTDKNKEIMNFINDLFNDHKIIIDAEQNIIDYYKSDTYRWLGNFYLKTNKFYAGYWFYNNLMKHFNNQDEMYEFIKLVIEKMIGKSLN